MSVVVFRFLLMFEVFETNFVHVLMMNISEKLFNTFVQFLTYINREIFRKAHGKGLEFVGLVKDKTGHLKKMPDWMKATFAEKLPSRRGCRISNNKKLFIFPSFPSCFLAFFIGVPSFFLDVLSFISFLNFLKAISSNT